MRKLLFVGIIIFCSILVHAQDEVKEVIIPGEEEKEQINDDVNEYFNNKFSDAEIGDIIMVVDTVSKVKKPTKEVVKTPPPPPETKTIEHSTTSRNVTSSSSNRSSSARKSSSRKRSKRKKIGFKRKRPNKIKRKPKLGNRAACPRF